MKGQPTLFTGETRCFYGCGHTTFERITAKRLSQGVLEF